MKKIKLSQRLTSIFLCAVILLSYLPITAKAAPAPKAQAITNVATDPGTADSWEHMMGTDADGNRYAGRVWVDKSVYKNGDTARLNSKNDASSSFRVELAEDEAFQVIFSALGSTMTTKESVTSTGPMDVVIVLDNSDSMQNSSRMQETIDAANKLLVSLLENNDVRVGITAYEENAAIVLPFGTYENGIELRFNRSGVITAYDESGTVIDSRYKSNGYELNTNIQAGFELGMEMLASASNTTGRNPVAILLTDGAANTAVDTLFKGNTEGTVRQIYYNNNIDPVIALSTLLSNSYNKALVEKHYGVAPMVYGIGVDLSATDGSNAIINPKDNFNDNNANRNICSAYGTYANTWANGQNVEIETGSGRNTVDWFFGHSYPAGSGITDEDVKKNIHYVDTYYSASSEELEGVFEQIYQELSSGVFNPISSTTTTEGGTGVEHTPLIYVDFIGKHMEVKAIQAVSLFGASYSVIDNGNGTYTVNTATGVNPTTGESWNTSEDIRISVTEEADGTQKLEVRIDQEILPILMEQVSSQTVGDETTATIIETGYNPLRIFYTVGVDSDILLPDGQINISALSGYEYLDAENGKAVFYANEFGTMNPPAADGKILDGDAHVGFKPSAQNRYYYHQSNQGIFTKITDKSGKTVTIPENEEYGIVWDESKYDLNWMTLSEYRAAKDDDTVYTYVTYYHPTPSASDEATAAEEVTYLVYSKWDYMKESVSFYDNRAGKYVNFDGASGFTLADEGVAIPLDKVDLVLTAYTQSNPTAELYAVLGVGSLRTSRLHNMTVEKTENRTQTALHHYTPEYTHETATVHNGNDVVIWLGNNGRLTMDLETGIALTKNVTRTIGNADDLYTLTVTLPAGVTATPTVTDADGAELDAGLVSYSGNVLSVKLRANETVYVSGIPAGTVCEIGENIPAGAEYYVSDKTATVKVPTVSEVLAGAAQYAPASVTNAPTEYGDLYITKEITGDHSIPDGILNTAFDIAVNVGTAFAGKSFEVKLNENGTVQRSTQTVDDGGDLHFSIKARHTVKILKIPAGTNVTVTETAPGSHFAVSYKTRNHSGETEDYDNALTIPANADATAVVYNRYTPDAATLDLDIAGTKSFIAEGNHAGGTFRFKVQKYENGTWSDVAGMTAETTYAANEHGEKTFRIENVLAGVTFEKVGSFAYRVLEVKGDVANVTYDRTLHSFNVHVTDENGRLVATAFDENQQPITGSTYHVLFTNTYHTAPVSLDVRKIVDDRSGDPAVSLEGFEFKAVRTNASWTPLTGSDAASFSIYTDAAGVARFTNVCTRAGTYYFVLSEVEDATKTAKGWTYSKAIYHVTVEVLANGEDLNATLTVEKTNSTNPDEAVSSDPAKANAASIVFENVYDPEDATVDLDGYVSKVLTGKTLESEEFTFYVYENGDRTTPVLIGTNDLAGDVTFVDFDGELVLSEVGKHEFDVVEEIPDGAVYDAATGKYWLGGMGYDPTIFDLVAEVTIDPNSGKLVASYYFEDSVSNRVTFHNEYAATPTEYTIAGSKLLHGRAPRQGEFTFELYEGDTLLETVTNDGSGEFKFKKLHYSEAGTYTYTVKEKAGSLPGVVYTGADHPITVVVTVTDQNGVLSASADVKNSEIRFENTYAAAPAKVNFSGTKTLEGATLADQAFSFLLYQTGADFDLDGAELLEAVKNASGAFTFSTRTLAKTGTYYFVIAEDISAPAEGIVYDRSEHRFAVSVSDIGNGQLTAVLTDVANATESTASATVSAKADFVNATFEKAAEKEVALSGNTSTFIDGKKVKAGDVLTYYITYTNYNGQDVVVDIMDAIPHFTSYVEGSASHGGTYAGTHLDWVLNVKADESVTVSFSVKVNEPEVILANTAYVRDGVNSYETNEVVNHTVDKVFSKDVYQSDDPEVSVDGKKVYEGDELLYTITYVNASKDAVDLEITDTLPANTTYVEGSASHGGAIRGGKLSWLIEDLAAWETVTVSFKVKVNAKIGATTIANEAQAFDGRNSFTSNRVTNHTVSDDVKKDVFLAKNPGVSIDGKKVSYGDELLYTISFKNSDGESTSVTVTDVLSLYVSYVEGSATDGGIYENGKITWTLTVGAGETKTVSFLAKVNTTEGKTVENQAVFQEGKNVYTSNVVKTHAEPLSTIIPVTGDFSNLSLWFALLFVSGTTIFVLPLAERRRKSAENK